jgi:hypothetical protein
MEKIIKNNLESFSYYFHNNIHVQRPIGYTHLTAGLRSLISYIATKYGTELTMVEIGSYNGESTIEFAKIFDSVIAVGKCTKCICGHDYTLLPEVRDAVKDFFKGKQVFIFENYSWLVEEIQ